MHGIVIRNTGNSYVVRTDDGQEVECKVKGNFRLRGIRSTSPVAVGDGVTVMKSTEKATSKTSGKKGKGRKKNEAADSGEFQVEHDETLFITEIDDRRNYIVRKASNLSKQSHILAANVDLALLVVTMARPETSTTFIDRFLASAEAYRVPTALVFNKMDDLSEEERERADYLMAIYSNIGYTCYAVSALNGDGIDALTRDMQGRICLLAGHSGVGKSTLLNVLLNEDKAIVSDIHGTTRDVIEDTTNIGGITFRFIDTAGIRETNDTIESLGIERTFQKLEQAEIVLWMIDATDATSQINQLSGQILPRLERKHLILVFNKADLLGTAHSDEVLSAASSIIPDAECIFISAKKRQNTDVLQKKLIAAANLPTITQNDVIVTNARHYEALTHALEAIERVQQGLANNLSGDFVAQDIRECIFHLSDIAGEVTNDMVLQNIFQHFCIGK